MAETGENKSKCRELVSGSVRDRYQGWGKE